MRYLIALAFFVLPVLAFAGGQDAGAVNAAADTASSDPLTAWNAWARTSSLGQIVTGFVVSGLMLGITKIRGSINDRGGALGVAGLALFGGVASSLVVGAPLDPTLVEATVAVLLAAIGGYTFVKKVAFPADVRKEGLVATTGEFEVKPVPQPPPLPPPPAWPPEGT